MDINELRINNLVKSRVPNGFAIYRVSAIDGINSKVLLSKKETEKWVGMDMVFPVPITEKILLEYNFREMDMGRLRLSRRRRNRQPVFDAHNICRHVMGRVYR